MTSFPPSGASNPDERAPRGGAIVQLPGEADGASELPNLVKTTGSATLTRASLEILLTMRGLEAWDIYTTEVGKGLAIGRLTNGCSGFRLTSGDLLGEAALPYLAAVLSVWLPEGGWTGETARYGVTECVLGPFSTQDELDLAVSQWMEVEVEKPRRRQRAQEQQAAAAAKKAARQARRSI